MMSVAHRTASELAGWAVRGAARSGSTLLLALVLLVAGCGAEPTRSSRVTTPDSDETEPNDSFIQAHKARLANGRIVLSGTIEDRDDLDVFDLGPLSAGQRVVVDLKSETEGLDASAALFDTDSKLVMDNDDQDLGNLNLDPFFEHVVRHDGGAYFLVVGRSAFAGSSAESGDYSVTVRVTSGAIVPEPKSQTLYLNFDGGQVAPDNLLVKEVRSFSGAAIDRMYAGQDDVLKQAITDTMLENYETFDVAIVTNPDELPQPEQYTTIMFGSRNARAFGISESVDHYNGDQGDVAIVFTESFDPSQFTFTPSAEELGVAIGNIAAHEAGHLLGLNHVDDVTALMDAVSPADTFLDDQNFKNSTLSGDILPIGFQDAPLLLSQSVGLREGFALQRPRTTSLKAGPRLRDPDARSWCGTCNRKLER